MWTFQEGRSLLQKYCMRCHSAGTRKGALDLQQYDDRNRMVSDPQVWNRVLRTLRERQMPPDGRIPTAEEYHALETWTQTAISGADAATAERAGHVALPRLTQVEYSNTMRDLLGIDLHAGELLSADGAGRSGFANDREALFLSTADLEKYLAAAERSLHAVMAVYQKPWQQRWESESMLMTENAEKPQRMPGNAVGYVLSRGQMTLYESVTVPVDGYYRFTIRSCSTAGPTAALLSINDERRAVVAVPTDVPAEYGVLVFLRAGSYQMTWNLERPEAARAVAGLDSISSDQQPLAGDAADTVTRESLRNAPAWPATAGERELAPVELDALQDALVRLQQPYEKLRLPNADNAPAELRRLRGEIAERLVRVTAAINQLAETLQLSPQLVSNRLREANRFRMQDNQALYVEAGRQIDRLTYANATRKRPGDVMIDWVQVIGPLIPEGSQPADEFRIDTLNETGPELQNRLTRIASRAFRRPVEDHELEAWLKLYAHARQAGVSVSEAFRASCGAILISPHFLYRVELADAGDRPDATVAAGTRPLNSWELASRLSYFLWLSMPDPELRQRAASGEIQNPGVLAAEARRLLADSRSESLAKQFSGGWLGLETGAAGGPDRSVFPQYTDQLAADMRQETTLMFQLLLRGEGRLHELLWSDRTFLNQRLAEHYGIRGLVGEKFRLVALNDQRRGGLLGMGSVLTATSGANRTSPVTRGKWILETLLGQRVGQPPPDAGVLPENVGMNRDRTLREELERHRRDPHCASCHQRIDPLGFGLEEFDAIGRFRRRDIRNPIDLTGVLPDGTRLHGAVELKRWLVQERLAEFRRQLSERLLSFALGRQLQSYDEPAVRQIIMAAEDTGGRLDAMVEAVVQTTAFRFQDAAASVAK